MEGVLPIEEINLDFFLVPIINGFGSKKFCLSCGEPLPNRRRRYCQKECREEFEFKLKWFNNLLRTFKTRYATFYFTKHTLILNVLTYMSKNVYTFFYKRTPGLKPAKDMGNMVFELGNLWWLQIKNKKSRSYASWYVLSQGKVSLVPPEMLIPRREKYITGIKKSLDYLDLSKDLLINGEITDKDIKSAFRKAALKYHPDMGGSSIQFRKLKEAYEHIKSWLQNPTFYTRRGIPGQWSYVGSASKWYSPL